MQSETQPIARRRPEHEYDKLNRTIFTHSDRFGLNLLSQVGYNELGHRIAETNETDLASPNNIVVTRFGYDALGRLTAVTNASDKADQIVTRYTYNRFGELATQTDPNDHTTTFTYNKFGQRIRRTLPNNQYEEFFYDAAGNKTIHTNFTAVGTTTPGFVTELRYDALNRLTNKFERGFGPDSQSPRFAQFVYNATGQRLIVTNRYVIKDSNSQVVLYNGETRTLYEYDGAGRLKTRTLQFPNEIGRVISYSYGERNNLFKVLVEEVAPVHYAWNTLNQLAYVTNNPFGEQEAITTYSYDVLGNLKTVSSGKTGTDPALATVKTSYSYDAVNRLDVMQVNKTVGQTTTAMATFDYVLGRTPKRRGVTEFINAGVNRTVNYSYDFLDRLTKEEIIDEEQPSGTISYDASSGYGETDGTGYDRVGNRRSRQAPAALQAVGVTQYAGKQFNANDQFVGVAYDANGNTLDEALPAPAISPSATFPDEYDFENRLIRRRNGTVTIDLQYDGDGNRIRKKITQDAQITTVTYLVDDLNPTGYSQVLSETETVGNAATTIRYTHGHDLISATIVPVTPYAPPSTHWYGYDGHGSVRFLTDAFGNITDVYIYDAFGIRIAGTAVTPNNYLYAGEYWDPYLGKYYNRARVYNPFTGRFWTSDPWEGRIEDPTSLHKYLYAHLNPVNATDPSGLMTLIEMKFVAANLFVLGTVMVYRAAPAVNRATVLLFEATTGNTVYMGGGGSVVALKAGTTMGGVGWRTWQFVGNLLKGTNKKIGPKKELSKALEGTGWQANHLNQAKAFEHIPYEDGVSLAMELGTNNKGHMHWRFHDVLEAFWKTARDSGRKTVTNAEYNKAMREGLEAAGFPPEEVNALANLAEESRIAYKYFDGPGGLQPKVPGAIPMPPK